MPEEFHVSLLQGATDGVVYRVRGAEREFHVSLKPMQNAVVETTDILRDETEEQLLTELNTVILSEGATDSVIHHLRHISPNRFTVRAGILFSDVETIRPLLTETDLEITNELDETIMAEVLTGAYVLRARG